MGIKGGKGILPECQGFPDETLKELHMKSEVHAAVNKLNHNTNKPARIHMQQQCEIKDCMDSNENKRVSVSSRTLNFALKLAKLLRRIVI